MHNIDRTQLEGESLYELEPEDFEFSGEDEAATTLEWEADMESGQDGEAESLGYEGAFEAEAEAEASFEDEGPGGPFEAYDKFGGLGETYEAEAEAESAASMEAPLHEAMEMEMAAELLEVMGEDELDQFLGKLIRRVGSSLGKVVRSPIGRAIGGVLKPYAKMMLPLAGGALGAMGGPVGSALGGQLGSMAGRAFGLELEGLSAEDREFEVARRYVRLASSATQKALKAPPHVHPDVAARTALRTTARRIAPGLLRAPVGTAYPSGRSYPAVSDSMSSLPIGGRRRGIWVRRGRGILILGA
jgi:uncharacterized protein (DUF697 family)